MKKYLLCTVSLLVISSCRNENEISIVKTETASNEILALQLDDIEPIRAGVNFLLEGKIISNQKISEAKIQIIEKNTQKLVRELKLPLSGFNDVLLQQQIYIEPSFLAGDYLLKIYVKNEKNREQQIQKELKILPALFQMNVKTIGKQGIGKVGEQFDISAEVKSNKNPINTMRIEIIDKRTPTYRIDERYNRYEGKIDFTFQERVHIPENFPKGEYYFILIAYDADGYTYFEKMIDFK